MGLHGAVGGEVAGLGREVLGGVGLLGARQSVVVATAGVAQDVLGRPQTHVGIGEGEGHTLIRADGVAEHDALGRVRHGSAQRRPADPESLGGDEDALGIEPVEQVVEAAALVADAVGLGHEQVVVAHLA